MDDLLRAVHAQLDKLLDGHLCDLVADNGAAGLCWDVSHELVTRLGRGHLLYLDFDNGCAHPADERRRLGRCSPFPEWARQYISDDMHDYGHCVAVIDGYVVDLTAKQFGDHLPFPMVVPL